MDFNTQEFAKIVENALALSYDRPRWQKAIERAADGLKSGAITVSESAVGAIVTTENGSYLVSGRGCQCPAYEHGNKPCKHRAAKRLYELYTVALVESQVRRHVETRTTEYDWRGNRFEVVRCDGWMV